MGERRANVGADPAGRMLPVRISGCASGFPAGGRWLANEAVHALRFGQDWPAEMARLGADPAYYEAKLGVRRRYWAHTPGQDNTAAALTALDLMEAAAGPALERAAVKPDQLDAVIAVTITSPFYTTAVSAHLAHRLGVQAPAFDLRSGCASGIFALVMAAQLIQGGARHVLLALGDTNSKLLDPTNNTVYAGGDAGAAVVLSRSEGKSAMLAHYIDTDGRWSGHTGVPGLLPPTSAEVEARRYTMQWRDDGKEAVLDHAWALIPAELYQRTGLTAADIACLVPHQAAKRQLALAAKEAGLPPERMIDVLADYANCGPATLFLALERAFTEGRINAGDRYLLAAAGGGLSWGGIILQH